MSTYYYALKNNGDYIFDNFPSELKNLITDYKDGQKVFDLNIGKEIVKARMGKKRNDYGTMFVLTTDEKYVKRYKLFKELMDISIIAIRPTSEFQNQIIADQSSQTQEFIHNVTSLNSYSIQELFTLIPQSILTGNITKQEENVKNIISEKPNLTVKTLLKLIKYNLAMKVEFSVFERTLKTVAVAQKLEYSIRDIVLSILQIFIDEFEEKKIEISLDASEDACVKRISVDYDSLFVSFYYILENSIKYCCPNTKYKIIFKEETASFSILFIMISIKIDDSEIHKLTTRGYRSNLARNLNKEGNGIGMYRILKTLRLNDAELEITPRINNFRKIINGIEYEANQFKIKFLGQQNWFKLP